MQFEIDHSIAKKAEAGHGRPYPASSPFGGSCVSPRTVKNAAARFRQSPLRLRRVLVCQQKSRNC